MFSKLNDLTLTTLVYELFEVRVFKKGQIIMEQSKSAPTNQDYKQFYQVQLSKLAEQIKKRKSRGKKENDTSNNSMMADQSTTP